MLRRGLSLAILQFFLCLSAMGQFEVGSLVGVVRDQAGSVIPGATVVITNQATNAQRQTVTSSAGAFDFVALTPGQYSVSAKQSGFEEITQNFEIAVSQRLELNLTMRVGAETQNVTVSASVENIETASSDISNVRTEQQVVGLPLNARNFTQLVQLAPGVNNHGNNSASTNGGFTSARGTNGAVINGNPPEATSYLIDGVLSTDQDAGVIVFFPPVDSIQEFKVQTSDAPASYGTNPEIINVTFRSGTNHFHGVFYEFLRNSMFDAKNYFDSHTNRIPPFHMNQFGANVGGPVIIPHLFNGKDRLFFFADFEGKRVSQAQTYVSTVPTAAFHTGNFAALLPKTVLHVPGTTTPLPNNQVQQINTVSAALMALFPLPNINPANPALVNNYLYNGQLLNIINQGDLRVDYRTAQTAIFGRFTREDPDTTTPGYLPPPAVGTGPGFPGHTVIPSWQGVLGYGRSIGPNKYYEERIGYSRLDEEIVGADSVYGDLAEQLGIPNANAGGALGLTGVTISGNAGVGDSGDTNLRKLNNDWEFDQALSWIVGNHELKFGFNWLSRRFAFYSPVHPVGTYTFSGVYTGYGLADFLYGKPLSSELDATKFFSMLRFEPSLYVQDNWRVTPRLTLNMGLRDDFVTPWVERANRLAGFVPMNGGTLVPVGTPPYYGNTITDGRYTNFGPRFGFAYSLNAKTVIRGGAGIFYALNEQPNSNPQAKNAPFNGSFIQTNSAGTAGYAAALPISAGFPEDRPALFPIPGSAFSVYLRRYIYPSANQWNLNIQRQLTGNDVLSVAYVGQTGVHILALPNINQATPGSGAVAARRPYPNLADATYNCLCGNSAFNSLQVSYIHRLSAGFDFQGVYTYGHSTDNSSGTSNTIAPQNPFTFSTTNRGNSDFDLRHSAVLSWSLQLPFGQGKRVLTNAHGLLQAAVGGWQLNSIDTFQTGSPFTPVMATSLLNAGSAAQWPNRIGPGTLSNRGVKEWFNVADFVSPGTYVFGNSGRNILFGPGTKQFDASLFKNLAFSKDGSRYIQLRAETFNIFNTPQFNNPSNTIGVASAGTITSAGQPLLFQRTSREIQLAAKLYW
jgi:Carboxypeptidase regulatory-like domain/TonB-dependent Receptor Plug Domain